MHDFLAGGFFKGARGVLVGGFARQLHKVAVFLPSADVTKV
ncbi:MAG: hypothetical protein Q7S97_07295 [Polaromonas sp.]|nr:hypothetical protein [Polaromonas sp.]